MNTQRLRYKQYEFHCPELDTHMPTWSLERFGCGPTAIANILANYGFNVTPTDALRKIIFDQNHQFDPTFLSSRGILPQGLLYCLDRFIHEDHFSISYQIIKINFSNPHQQKQKILNLVRAGSMAIIHVGPSPDSPLTFSKHGHYLAASDIDAQNNFYVINSNRIGDAQVNIPFSYELIIQNMLGRKDSFNFLFIKQH